MNERRRTGTETCGMRRCVLLSGVLTGALIAPSAGAAGPTVSLTSPANGAVLGDSFAVSGTLQSTYTISSVQAQLQGGAAQSLTLSGAGYNGTLDASSVAVGPMTLTVTATDSLAGVGSVSVNLIHDHPPTISAATQSGFVARPDIHLQATCSDADMYGCATVSVSVGSTVIASANGSSLDAMVSLSQYDHTAVTLTFTATDAQGMSASLSRQGNVDTGLDLPIVAQGDGPILSFDPTRILFATDTSLVIRPRAGGTDTVAGSGSFSTAYLTSHGAIWPGGEWRDGVPLTNTATADLVASGDYAGWTTMQPLATGTVGAFWRNVATDTTTQIATGGYETYGPNVASNGDMVFTWIPPGSQYEQVYRYRGGTLAQASGGCVRCDGAVTDGVNVVYQQHLSGAGVRGETYLYDGSTVTVLDNAAHAGGGVPPAPPPDYTAVGGWTAFTMLSNPMTGIVYTRSPAGTVAQASVFNADTIISGLSDTGDVVYTANGSLYLGSADGGAPSPFDCRGKITYQAGSWYGVYGQLLVSCGVSAGGDGGVSDAGGSGDAGDAGSSAGSDAGAPSDGATTTGEASTAGDAGASDDGRPSGSGGDASASDAGMLGEPDAAGTTMGDGASADASGAADANSSTTSGGGSSGGGGCSVARRRGEGMGALGVWLAVVLASVRRRRPLAPTTR